MSGAEGYLASVPTEYWAMGVAGAAVIALASFTKVWKGFSRVVRMVWTDMKNAIRDFRDFRDEMSRRG